MDTKFFLMGKIIGEEGGGDKPDLVDLTATDNGTYRHVGHDGYDKVVVNVPKGVTPTGNIDITTTSQTDVTNYATATVVDSDLTASNIKKDVDILGVVGTYEAEADLEDITITQNGTYTHSGKDGYDEVVVAVPEPSGNINITDTNSTNVSAYATAQVVDLDLVAGNIKKDVNILGVVGTYEAGGSTPDIESLSISANGTYTATNCDGYSPITVAVPNSYAAGDEGKVVSNGALVSQSSTTKTANGTYDTTLNNSVTIAVPQPSGNINITDMQSTDVTNYATAQVVDSDLVAGNIKKDVNILGVTGTYEGSGGGAIPSSITLNDPNGNADSLNNRGYFTWAFQNGLSTINIVQPTSSFNYAFAYLPTSVFNDWSGVKIENTSSVSRSVKFQYFMYQSSYVLKPITLSGLMQPTNCQYMFGGCYYIKIPYNYFDDCDFTYCGYMDGMFQDCRGMRTLPDLTNLHQKGNQAASYGGQRCFTNGGISGCYNLDEAINLPLPKSDVAYTRNMFSFGGLMRVKELTFMTNNGTPYSIMPASDQTLDLSNGIGYCGTGDTSFIEYAGISANKRVTDLTSYNALKDDPDWWTTEMIFSRYNHDSAVNTINSLPTMAGTGTGTIIFNGLCGSGYGKAISSLTSAEKAVAENKGWTVTVN